MINVSSKKRTTIWNVEKPYTDFRLNKKLALAIRQLGSSGDSAQDLLYKIYKVIAGSPELRKKVKAMSKYNIDGEFRR